jgi:acyl-CoA thioester hydrolase
MEAAGVIMPIVELQCKFLRPAHYDDLLTVKTILKELPAGHRIEFHQEVYNEAGKLLTIGHVVLYFLDSRTRERTRMPEPLRRRLEPYFNGNAQVQD